MQEDVIFPRIGKGPKLMLPFGGGGICGVGRKKAANFAIESANSLP